MLSKKSLNAFLADHKLAVKGEVGYEAYGRKVFAYVMLSDRAERARLEALLKKHGHKFDPKYSPGSACAEVAVSYFKAWHWDE